MLLIKLDQVYIIRILENVYFHNKFGLVLFALELVLWHRIVWDRHTMEHLFYLLYLIARVLIGNTRKIEGTSVHIQANYIWGENFELPVSCGRNCALRSLRNLIRLHRWDLLLNSHDFVVWGLFRKILDLWVQHSSVTILGFGFSLFKLLLDFSHFALSGRLKQHRGNLVWLRRCYLLLSWLLDDGSWLLLCKALV